MKSCYEFYTGKIRVELSSPPRCIQSKNCFDEMLRTSTVSILVLNITRLFFPWQKNVVQSKNRTFLSNPPFLIPLMSRAVDMVTTTWRHCGGRSPDATPTQRLDATWSQIRNSSLFPLVPVYIQYWPFMLSGTIWREVLVLFSSFKCAGLEFDVLGIWFETI